ncbi:hypothetical protein [Sphingorhabdus lacus]|uniref:Uncharacterized protein n=1 Tax=Sphingorhabdus lacus TaxID=392610 RepID=A0A6I6L4H4_9SPHN|nr:hypothetical protein [Sphingorhabdus lacus]QGY80805.1 hypothetical protein EUU25_09345 [Sphingorhabdus lacus]
MTDFDPCFIAGAIERFSGYQIVGFYEAYRLLGGTGDPDMMPVEMRKNLVRLLTFLGYKEQWAGTKEGDDVSLMWARNPWPADFLSSGEKETWIAAFDVKK